MAMKDKRKKCIICKWRKVNGRTNKCTKCRLDRGEITPLVSGVAAR